MAFTAGELCCAHNACVYIDTDSSSNSASWDKIPHVTEVSLSRTANTPKIVTSSTAGNETSVCGTISNTGTLGIACHNGTRPNLFAVNGVYSIVWGASCTDVEAVITETPGEYEVFGARIRVTSLNYPININGNQAIIYTYNFEIVDWTYQPTWQTEEETE